MITRLRYEIARAFAPHVGVEWSKKTGNIVRYAQLAGKDPNILHPVIGTRLWF